MYFFRNRIYWLEDEHRPQQSAVNSFRNTQREKQNTKDNNKLDDIWEFQRVTRQTRNFAVVFVFIIVFFFFFFV